MTWAEPAPGRYQFWAPLEVDAVRLGELRIWLNATLERNWTLKLRLGEDIFRWDLADVSSA